LKQKPAQEHLALLSSMKGLFSKLVKAQAARIVIGWFERSLSETKIFSANARANIKH
jgi:hypothetical protein